MVMDILYATCIGTCVAHDRGIPQQLMFFNRSRDSGYTVDASTCTATHALTCIRMYTYKINIYQAKHCPNWRNDVIDSKEG